MVPQGHTVGQAEVGAADDAEGAGGLAGPVGGVGDQGEGEVVIRQAADPAVEVACASAPQPITQMGDDNCTFGRDK